MMFFLSGLGIFFSILLLFHNKGYKTANIYLGLFLLLFNFITVSHYLYIFSNSREFIALVLSIPINASAYVIGPLAFFYVRSILTDNPKLTKYDVLHFILFALITCPAAITCSSNDAESSPTCETCTIII